MPAALRLLGAKPTPLPPPSDPCHGSFRLRIAGGCFITPAAAPRVDFSPPSKRKSEAEEDGSRPGSRGTAAPQRSRSTPRMAKFLSQDQINEFKECFSLYDKKHKGKIKASDLITVMRCLGSSPTPGEVAKHLQAHKVGANAELDFSTFLSVMHKQMQQADPENEILLAMLMTDERKTGHITVAELKAKLTGLGEKLSGEEVDTLLKEARVGHNGLIKYEDLVKFITGPVAVDH